MKMMMVKEVIHLKTTITYSPFVCISDVTGNMEKLNTVIFNPILSKENNKIVIKKECNLRYDLMLSDEQLESLVNNSVNDFITELHGIIVRHKANRS